MVEVNVLVWHKVQQIASAVVKGVSVYMMTLHSVKRLCYLSVHAYGLDNAVVELSANCVKKRAGQHCSPVVVIEVSEPFGVDNSTETFIQRNQRKVFCCRRWSEFRQDAHSRLTLASSNVLFT